MRNSRPCRFLIHFHGESRAVHTPHSVAPHLYGTPLYLFIELSIDNFIGALSLAGADKRGIFLVFLFATGEDFLFPPLSEVYLGDGFIPAQPDKRVRAIKAAIVILYLFTNPHDQHSPIS